MGKTTIRKAAKKIILACLMTIGLSACLTAVTSFGNYRAKAESTALNFSQSIKNHGGNWVITDDALTADNTAEESIKFAMTDISAGKDKDLKINFDVTAESGSMTLAFGVADYNNPDAGFYGLDYNADGLLRLVGGSLTEGEDIRSARLTAGIKHTVGLEAYANGRIVCKADGNVFADTYDCEYKGGYFGFGSKLGKGEFSNVSYEITDATSTSFEIKTLSDYDILNYRNDTWEDGWVFEKDSLTANNEYAEYDLFSVSALKAGESQDLIFEADVSTSSNLAGLCFGVQDHGNPSGGWYGYYVGKEEVRLFSVNTGTVGSDVSKHRFYLKEGEKTREFNRLKVQVDAHNKLIYMYLNGELKDVIYDSGYTGGYLAFYTNKTNAVFKNIKVSITDNEKGVAHPTNDVMYEDGSIGMNLVSHIKYSWGIRTIAPDFMSVRDPDGWNNLAATDICVQQGQDLYFAADVECITNNQMLIFGINNNANPGNGGFYALTMTRGGIVRVSAENAGTLGAGDDFHAYRMTDEEKQTTKHRLELFVLASGEIRVKFDGKDIIKTYESKYKGGYIGFGNWKSYGTVSNVVYKITDAQTTSFEIADMTDYGITDYRSGFAWGNWTYDSGIIGNNTAVADHFTMSTLYQKPNQNLILEADVLVEGPSGGIVFGVSDISDPSGRGWYAFTVNKADRIARAFSVNKGDLGTASKCRATLTPAQLGGYVKLKVIARANGFLSFYADGKNIADFYDSKYNGGFIGFNTFFSKTSFRNIRVQLTDDEVGVSGVSVSGTDINFEEGKTLYLAEVKGVTDVLVTVQTKDNYTATINGETANSKKIEITKGKTLIEIETTNTITGKKGVVIIEIKQLYNEQYRPALHYTTAENWLNDPNGLMYDSETGLYHMFYQYSVSNNNDGVLLWGHATSTDLINWEDCGVAIKNNSLGVAWSGSGVIDKNNTSGLFDDSVPEGSRMVTFVTYQSANPKIGLCYSLDQGKTWLEYDKVVIENKNNMFGANFRDPKVLWYEDDSYAAGGIWLMIVGGFEPVRIFASENLLDWTFQSTVIDYYGNALQYECPDLFPLPLDGDENNIKWVLTTAGTTYIVGDLVKENGIFEFRTETPGYKIFTSPKLWTNIGEMYATQSYFNDALNRRILVSWMVDRTSDSIEDKGWNGAQSLPHVAELKTLNGMICMNVYPVKELEANRSNKLYDEQDVTLDAENHIEITGLEKNVYDLETTIDLGDAEQVVIQFAADEDNFTVITYDAVNNTLKVDTTKSGVLTNYVLSTSVLAVDNKITLRLIADASVFELFANGGVQGMMGFIFPPEGATTIKIYSFGNAKIVNLTVYSMKSMYEQKEG